MLLQDLTAMGKPLPNRITVRYSTMQVACGLEIDLDNVCVCVFSAQ